MLDIPAGICSITGGPIGVKGMFFAFEYCQESLDYSFLGGSNKNQIYVTFEGFPYCMVWVDNVMTPEIMFQGLLTIQ